MSQPQNSGPAVLPTTSWTQARAAGQKQYYTGVPCKHGHLALRDVSDRSCYTCKLAKAAAWKHANAEKHAAANALWAKKNPDGPRASQRRARAKEPRRFWARNVYNMARVRAAEKGIPFSMTVEAIQALAEAATHCPVFGTPFEYIGNGRIRPESPSLDRVKPELGYVPGNVAVISVKANAIKQDANWQQIQRVADWLREIE